MSVDSPDPGRQQALPSHEATAFGDDLTLAGPSPSPRLADEPGKDPGHIGRHVVIHRLGAGGMGVVYAAYDPELDRKLAIKLIRPDRRRPNRHDRMLREAQAMAKVSHPNVISVYDVGTFEGQVFIAMEFVAGGSLGEWLDAHPIGERDWRTALELFAQAGEGLAAAHEVGLVHRDFKPDNVLVGEHGRVRVLDFGLARAADHGEGPLDPTQLAPELDAATTRSERAQAPASPGLQDAERQDLERGDTQDSRESSPPRVGGTEDRRENSLLDQNMTRVGSLVGTPAYMPPEHLAGRRSGTRGDQFSFCVALWEGLYGERPFRGATIPAVFQALLSDSRREPPSELRARIPDWLHAAVERGLAHDPDARWPDMRALLDALRPPQSNTSRWVLGAALGVALLASVAALALSERDTGPSLCRDSAQQLDGVWDDGRRAALRQAFASSQRSYAERSADTVIEHFDLWTQTWVATRTDACEATHLRGEQSPELLDLRMACLDQRLTQLDALVDVLIEGDVETLAQAASAASRLDGLSACNDTQQLLGGPARPDDPALATRLTELEGPLARVEGLHAAGRYQEALTLVKELEPEIEALDWTPLEAQLLLERGRLDSKLGDDEGAHATLVRALARALEGGDEPMAASAVVDLLSSLRLRHETFAELDRWAELASALLRRVDDPLLEAHMHRALGKSRWERAEYDLAITHYERALALREQHLRADHLLVIESRIDLGHVQLAKGEVERASEIFVAGRARYVEELGAQHPTVAKLDRDLGGVAWRTGDYEAALEHYGRALAIQEAAFGADHPEVISLVANIGVTHAMQEDFRGALPFIERAVTSLRARGPSTLLASNLDNLAGAEIELGNHARARALYREGLEVREQLLDADHPDLARSLINMAQLELKVGDAQAAKVLLERALTLREGVEVNLMYRARARWKLAQALHALGQHEQVRELLEGARDDYAATGMAGAEQRNFEERVVELLGEPL